MFNVKLNILISPEQKQTWVAYAESKGISLGELIRTSVEKEIKNEQEQSKV